MRQLALIATLITSLTPFAWAWTEPISFHGVPWGASVDQAREILNAATTVPSEAFCYGLTCVWDKPVGPVPARVSFEFEDNRFVRGIVRFDPGHFPAIARVFVDHYGPPTEGQVPAGGREPGRGDSPLWWRGETVVISLERRDNSNQTGRATVTLKQAPDRTATGLGKTPNLR